MHWGTFSIRPKIKVGFGCEIYLVKVKTWSGDDLRHSADIAVVMAAGNPPLNHNGYPHAGEDNALNSIFK